MHGSGVGKMEVDIKNYIQKCLPCQLKKFLRNKAKQTMVWTDTPETASDEVAIDIVGPKTKSGNEYV